jgi:hypothetical protein
VYFIVHKTTTDDTASSEGGSSSFPISRGCDMVTLAINNTTTPLSEGTLVPLTVLTVRLHTTVVQPENGLLLSSYKSIRRSNKREPTLDRPTLSAGLHNSDVNSSVSEWPLRLSWSNCTTTSPCSRQSGP